MLRAVLFDVDFTLFRPGLELGPEGYRHLGERYGLELDPARYEHARLTAIEQVPQHPELEHDEQVWIAFTEAIMEGMGGPRGGCRECATAMVREWERHENFQLYEDAIPALEQLRAHGLKVGLVSNGQRDLDEFVAHHRLQVDVAVGSLAHGRIKPHPSIFERALGALGVAPEEAAMVGDSLEDDIAGARALGMRALLVDRNGVHAGERDRIDTLLALPAALGLPLERVLQPGAERADQGAQ
ncbi:MAG TPA: HAD-IA family hydrolase [Gaiellaceae bacterium]|nr:HAD-IA family hydrolase [Gaiellaceae bacterium]